MVFEKSLTAMVKGIRANRGKEADYIAQCIQEIQREITSTNLATKSMAILKLAYLSMLGYDMSWSTFAVVEVMSHSRFAVKRPGYLASAMCFTDNTDVGLLTINLFKKDFGSKSQYESGMAISTLSSICTPQISKDVLNDLTAMLASSRAYLRKKTVLCLYRVFLKDPPALRACFPRLKERLGDEDQGVLTATVNTFLELARKNARNYLSLVPQLYHILVNTTNNWLSIKLLKLFQLLCPLEPRLPAKLVEPLTNHLNTTKAQSVEIEVIRCVLKTMPYDSELVALAVERLQAFVNSSDRNLRYLGLELFRDALQAAEMRERFPLTELHATVLQSIEETDATARCVALQLLDTIVSPQSFVDTVKRLMEFSKQTQTCPSDEFAATILRMGSRDCFALVEDFAWYLLVLAELSRNVRSTHAAEIAGQFIDICVRVAGVRPYAATLALSLLDRDPAAPAGVQGAVDDAPAPSQGVVVVDVAAPMFGACAWVIGEYHEGFKQADMPVERAFTKAAAALLDAKRVQALDPTTQSMCVWAAAKLLLGAPRHAPAASADVRAELTAKLPAFVASTHVDVSERATLTWHLAAFFNEAGASVDEEVGVTLFDEALLPIAQGSQEAVPKPEGLDFDEPFFEAEQQPQTIFAPTRSDPSDPFALAATYRDDLGLQAGEASQPTVSPSLSSQQASSMYYLNAKGKADAKGALDGAQTSSSSTAAPAAPLAPLDPLEQMREKLAAARATGGATTKYEVLREGAPAPARPAQAAADAAIGAGTSTLGIPSEKELSELMGRLWTVCYSDTHLRVFACVRSKVAKKQQLRVDLRCERVLDAAGSGPLQVVADVALRLPAAVTAAEADASGCVVMAAGVLQGRSGKVRANLGLAAFLLPAHCMLGAEVQYRLGDCSVSFPLQLALPATFFLLPAPMSEDDVATFISDARLLKCAAAVSLAAPGRPAAELAAELPDVVGRCAGLCHMYGIQQGQKFLLVAAPPAPGASALAGQAPLPESSRIVCLVHGLPRDGITDVRVTVKACRQDVCDDVCGHFVTLLRELVEGRLSARA